MPNFDFEPFTEAEYDILLSSMKEHNAPLVVNGETPTALELAASGVKTIQFVLDEEEYIN